MKKQYRWLFPFTFSVLVLSGCATAPQPRPEPFVSANRVVQKTVTIQPPQLKMDYQLTQGASPAVVAAYKTYLKTGEAKTIQTDEFVQFPYDTGQQPVVKASVLAITLISLKPGEKVTNVSSSDPTRWSYSIAYSGQGDTRQAQIMVKPSQKQISTDLVITTDQHYYLLKMVSIDSGDYVRNVRFWYPQNVQQFIADNNQQQQNQAEQQQQTVVSEVNLDQLNFNYKMTKTNNPSWVPERVFDDGTHTFIKFPDSVASNDLPPLFVMEEGKPTLVNYRTRAVNPQSGDPSYESKEQYYKVDKVFHQAVLLMGVGGSQQRVDIINLNRNS